MTNDSEHEKQAKYAELKVPSPAQIYACQLALSPAGRSLLRNMRLCCISLVPSNKPYWCFKICLHAPSRPLSSCSWSVRSADYALYYF